MREILTASQMKKCDAYTSEYFGIEPVVLMERAALTTFISICNCGKMYEDSRTLVVCGTGNNGADGLALARIMYEGGYSADYCIPFDGGKHSELFERQKDILDKYGLVPVSKDALEDGYDIVVDALFGIGLNRPLTDVAALFIDKLNHFKGFRVALDIPSGINADTGSVMGSAFRADITVTFGFAKRGQILFPGKDYVGKLLIANIGITERSLAWLDEEGGQQGRCFVMEKEDVTGSLPVRPDDGNKGTFGKVLIYAGNEDISGACVLASIAALKSGAGMVKVITRSGNADILKKTVPEAMVTTLRSKAASAGEISETKEKIRQDIAWADVILAGPGIGTGEESSRLLGFLLENAGDKPFVLDADALNIISAGDRERSGQDFREIIQRRSAVTIFTPHIGELSRLTGKSATELKSDIIKCSNEYAADAGVILVAKDAVTCVSDGSKAVLVSTGNNGMATAGSGDVLAGITAALVAVCAKTEKYEAFTAVLNAVYIHGLAGSACLDNMAEDSVTAGDIIISLPGVIKEIRDEQKNNQAED